MHPTARTSTRTSLKLTMQAMNVIAVAGFVLTEAQVVHAEQTTKEKISHTGKKAKNASKKAAHRVQESVCMEGDLKCAAKKAEHRVDEGADATETKASEVKDKMD